MLALLLAACSDGPAPGAAATAADESAAAPRNATAAHARGAEANAVGAVTPAIGALPADACTPEGYWSFFETFVREPTLRARYSDDGGRKSLASFDIAQRDSRWVRGGDAGVALDIRETRQGDTFVVAATPVELDADDEVVRTLGETARYRFEFKEGCWRFAGTA